MLFSTANDNTKISLCKMRSLSQTTGLIGIVLCMVGQATSSTIFEATPYGILQGRQTSAASGFCSNQEAGNAVFSFLLFRCSKYFFLVRCYKVLLPSTVINNLFVTSCTPCVTTFVNLHTIARQKNYRCDLSGTTTTSSIYFLCQRQKF